MQAAGTPGEVMLVMDGPDFSSQAAHDIVNILEAPAPSLPQEEPRLRVTSTVATAGFTSMVRRARNVVMVEIDPSRYSHCKLHTVYDQWATGQLVVKFTAPALDSVSSYVRAHEETFVNLIVRHELFRLASATEESISQRVIERTDSLFGLRFNVPRDIQHHKIGENFLWMSNAQMRQRRDILVYTYPYRSNKDLGLDRLIEVRDSVLKQNIKGEFEGTYPSTVRGGLYYRKVQLPRQPQRTEVRGLWQMEGGAMMGGPFVQHAFLDSAKRRVVVAEGFVYHPNEEKLTLIRTMEAALYSLRPSSQTEYNPQIILSSGYTRAR